MRCLVTGGAGFIGSHIVERLIKEGHTVRVLDDFSSGKVSNLHQVNGKFELMVGDIRNQATCDIACKDMDTVFHLAAWRSVPKSLIFPETYNDVNINGTLKMLKAATSCSVQRFIFASSSSVYGTIGRLPLKEEYYPQLISPYALTKLSGEYYCRIFSLHYGLETICLRYFNVFGPRQAWDDEYSAVIPKFIKLMLADEMLPIYGGGGQSRDFNYIDNVVNANMLAMQNKDIDFRVFNVGSGMDNTILNLVKVLERITGKEAVTRLLPERKGDVYRTRADITKIQKKLNYVPIVDFKEGLTRVVNYIKETL